MNEEVQSYLMAEVWNTALEDQEKRQVKPREKLWASELGGATIDLYLKLKGTELSNPPNARSLRKFEAGNIFETRFQTYVTALNLLSSVSSIGDWDRKNVFIWGHSNGGQVALKDLMACGRLPFLTRRKRR